MHAARSSLPMLVAGALGATLVAACQPARAPQSENGDIVPSATQPGDAAIRDTVKAVLDRGLANKAYPGAIAVVGTKSRVIAEYAVGHLDWAPSPVPNEHTLWDMASLTKVVGLTSGLMQLVDQGKVDIDAPVQRYLPDWRGPNKDKVLIRHLLTHTSGLPAFKAYDEITHDPDSLAVLMFNTPLDTTPGARMVYSDIGAYMAGRVLEQVTRQSLDQYLHDHVFEPAGMHETMYRPPHVLWPNTAPTELDTVQRHRLVRGMVHDERAYYLGGVSAHAGLFSTAHDVTTFVQMLMNGGRTGGRQVIPAAEITKFTKRQVEDRALGWQKPSGTNSAGHLMSEEAFGHTGFTGTSIWVDPKNDVFVVLLTNRVDPTREHSKIGPVRTQLADGVMHTILRDRAGKGGGTR